MTPQVEKALIAKLRALPPERLAEVEKYVDLLAARDGSRAATAQRLGEAFAKLDALNAPPMTADEVQAEIKASRTTRSRDADRR